MDNRNPTPDGQVDDLVPAGEPDSAHDPAEPLVQRASFDLKQEIGGRMVHRRRLLTSGAATALTLGISSGRSQDATPGAATPGAATPDAMAGHDMANMQVSPPRTRALPTSSPSRPRSFRRPLLA